MSFYFVLIPTICYLAASIYYATHGNGPLAVTYFGYSFANCGLLWLDRAMR